MRTTLNLDDDMFERLREYAENRSVSLGKAASELVRKGLDAPVETRRVNGFCAVVLPPGGSQASTERVRRLLEDEK